MNLGKTIRERALACLLQKKKKLTTVVEVMSTCLRSIRSKVFLSNLKAVFSYRPLIKEIKYERIRQKNFFQFRQEKVSDQLKTKTKNVSSAIGSLGF